MILVGDVGGTRTRLAFAAEVNGSIELSRVEESATTADVPRKVARFVRDAIQGDVHLEQGERPLGITAAAFGAAGPILEEGAIRLTNGDVRLEAAELAQAAGLARVVLVNDFHAIAAAIPHLPPAGLRDCGGGTAVAGEAVVVLGPGTGLGTAIGATGPGGWHAIQGDGGHADLAPVDDEELEVWQRLRRAHGRVSAETVLCGPGLERLYAAIAGRTLDASGIDAAAWRGEPEAVHAHALFTRWLGRVAGNLALIAGARGGVYLAGGILPRWSSRFDVAAFRRGFEDKGQYAGWLRAIPSFLITHPYPGLLGLAALARAQR
jgi:glucokinase